MKRIISVALSLALLIVGLVCGNAQAEDTSVITYMKYLTQTKESQAGLGEKLQSYTDRYNAGDTFSYVETVLYMEYSQMYLSMLAVELCELLAVVPETNTLSNLKDDLSGVRDLVASINDLEDAYLYGLLDQDTALDTLSKAIGDFDFSTGE